MNPPTRRTQRERTEATRAALVVAARRLFGAEGYAAVGTERIARVARHEHLPGEALPETAQEA